MKTPQPPNVDWLCFDLDNTLYPLSNGLWEVIDERIQAYVAKTLHLPLDAAKRLQKQYWRRYGTTLAGLMANDDVQPGPYLAFVHDFDVSSYLRPDQKLKRLLKALPQRKLIFTNASSQHAHNVLDVLEVTDFFDYIIGVEDVDFISKPDQRAYQKCQELTGINPAHSMFLDDLPENLEPAKRMGMVTVLVGSRKASGAEYIDYHIDRIEGLANIFCIDLPADAGDATERP